MTETIYTPELNNGSRVFVFGSNRAGIHGAGAALQAVKHWGAIKGHGEGRQGMAYGIPTKNFWYSRGGLLLCEIEPHVNTFLEYAYDCPELEFLVTRIGCGFAGWSDSDIAPLFRNVTQNCQLPKGWNTNAHMVK